MDKSLPAEPGLSKISKDIVSMEKWDTTINVMVRSCKIMEIKTVGIYGAGSMGRGLAQVAMEGGYEVVLYNHRTPTLEKGVAGIKHNFDKKIAKGKITQEQADAWFTHLKATTDLNDLANVDVVIEAMIENMELKKETFEKLAEVSSPRPSSFPTLPP